MLIHISKARIKEHWPNKAHPENRIKNGDVLQAYPVLYPVGTLSSLTAP